MLGFVQALDVCSCELGCLVRLMLTLARLCETTRIKDWTDLAAAMSYTHHSSENQVLLILSRVILGIFNYTVKRYCDQFIFLTQQKHISTKLIKSSLILSFGVPLTDFRKCLYVQKIGLIKCVIAYCLNQKNLF